MPFYPRPSSVPLPEIQHITGLILRRETFEFPKSSWALWSISGYLHNTVYSGIATLSAPDLQGQELSREVVAHSLQCLLSESERDVQAAGFLGNIGQDLLMKMIQKLLDGILDGGNFDAILDKVLDLIKDKIINKSAAPASP